MFASPVQAKAPIAPSPAPVVAQVKTEYTKGEMVQIATETASRYGLNVSKFLQVIEDESGWNQHARGDYRNGIPTSFGACQFHNPLRDWGITIEQADDPVFCFNLMAKIWVKGEFLRWSTY